MLTKTKANVDKFVEHFSKTTIDKATESTRQPVARTKIQSAASRVIPALASGIIGGFGELEKHKRDLISAIWRGSCHAVHSNYADVMQMYGPVGPEARFQLQGLPPEGVHRDVWDLINETRKHVALTLWAIAMKFGMGELAHEIGRPFEAP